MPGDYSRRIFDPKKGYASVLMQQGRVQLDSDWNEAQRIFQRRDETAAQDVIGHCGAPLQGGGFKLTAIDGGADLLISHGRIYVDGILCELDSAPVIANLINANPGKLGLPSLTLDDRSLQSGEWLEVFSEEDGLSEVVKISSVSDPDSDPTVTVGANLSGFTKVADENLRVRRVTTYLTQLNYPDTAVTNALEKLSNEEGSVLLAYLHVWQSEITSQDDPRIREVALGGPDTSARLKTHCQVELLPLSAADADANCGTQFADWDDLVAPSSGLLNVRTIPDSTGEDPCQLPPSSGYARLENQLYRVEVHSGTDRSDATFKWSRDNGSVEASIVEFSTTNPFQIEVNTLGPDDVLGFATNRWVEFIDDEKERTGTATELVEIDHVSPEENIITFKKDVSGYANSRKIRRWDQSKNLEPSGVVDIPPDAANGGWAALEGGIEVRFEEGSYRRGDYWLIPARSITGEVEWPPFEVPNTHPIPQPPTGLAHHYCRLAFVSLGTEHFFNVTSDCRCRFPSLNHTQELYYVGGDGQEVMPKLPVVASDLIELPQPLIAGVVNPQCYDSGAEVRFRVVTGTGRLSGGGRNGSSIDVTVDSQGLAICKWELGADPSVAENVPSQQVEARLLDGDGDPLHLPIRFNANLSIAEQVAYDPGDCAGLRDRYTVQEAIEQLADFVSLYKHSGDGQILRPGETPARVAVRLASRCGPIGLEEKWLTTEVVSGGGNVVGAVQINGDTASWLWAPGNGHETQEFAVSLNIPGDPRSAEPRRVVFTATRSSSGAEPGIRIDSLDFLSGAKLLNDRVYTQQDLARGIRISCDPAIDPATVQDKPTCFVTLELPFPQTPGDRNFWWGSVQSISDQAFGFQSIVLRASLGTDGRAIVWAPDSTTRQWLLNQLFPVLGEHGWRERILARLTVQGSYIWGEKPRDLFVDGDGFGEPGNDGGVSHTALRLPTGDDRRGGNLEMWFWLSPSGDSQPSCSLLAHYRLDEGAGADVMFDSYTFKRHGSYAGNFTLGAPSLLDSGAGTAVRFQDGESQGQVESDKLALRRPDRFTISLWMILEDFNSHQIIFAHGSAGATVPDFELAVDNGILTWRVNENPPELETDFGRSSVEIVHLALVHSAGRSALYIGGVEVASNDGGAPALITEGTLSFGAFNNKQGIRDGSLDDIQIYGEPLTPDQIGWLFENSGQFCPPKTGGGIFPGFTNAVSLESVPTISDEIANRLTTVNVNDGSSVAVMDPDSLASLLGLREAEAVEIVEGARLHVRDRFVSELGSISVSALPGIGPQTKDRLESLGIEHPVDMALMRPEELGEKLGLAPDSPKVEEFIRQSRLLVNERLR